jgi:hypothetical protein
MVNIVRNLISQISSSHSAQGSADAGRTPETRVQLASGQNAAIHSSSARAYPRALGGARIVEYLLRRKNRVTPATATADDAHPMGQSGESPALTADNRISNGVSAGSVHNAGHSERLEPADVDNFVRLLTWEEIDALSRLAPEDPERLEVLFEVVQSVCDRLRNEADQADNLSDDPEPLQVSMDNQRQAIHRWMNEHLDSLREPTHPASGAPNRDTSRPHAPDADSPAAKPMEEADSGPRVQGGRIKDEPDAHAKPDDYPEFAKDFFKLFEGTNEIQKMFMEMMLSWIRMIAEFSKKLNDIAARAI